MGRVVGVGLQPAAGEVAARVFGSGLAGASVGGEADDDDGLAVEDTEVGFVFCEVTVGVGGGGAVDGAVPFMLHEGAGDAEEGGRRGCDVRERDSVEDGGDRDASCLPAGP